MLMAVPQLFAKPRVKPDELSDLRLIVAPTVVDAVLAEGPPLAVVHRQVLAAAGLLTDDAVEWRRKAKIAAVLPQFHVRYRRSFVDHVDLSVKDSISVSGSGVVVGPRASDISQRNDQNDIFEVRASWAFNELLFTNDSLHVSREARLRRVEIRELLQRATQLYVAWQRLRVVVSAKSTLPGVLLAARLHLIEVKGELDALTGEWFSRVVSTGGGG